MRTLKILTFCLIFAAGSTGFSANTYHENAPKLQPGDWEKLGTKMVNMQADHDEIIVTGNEGVFTKIKLKVMKAPIHLLIFFGNGTNKNVVFNKMFAAGSETRVIDLPGNKRVIRKVNLNYKSVAVGSGRAVITLWGQH